MHIRVVGTSLQDIPLLICIVTSSHPGDHVLCQSCHCDIPYRYWDSARLVRVHSWRGLAMGIVRCIFIYSFQTLCYRSMIIRFARLMMSLVYVFVSRWRTTTNRPWNFTTFASSGELVHDPCVEPWQALYVNPNSRAGVDSDKCRVERITLYGRGVRGQLPSSLGLLDALLVCELLSAFTF